MTRITRRGLIKSGVALGAVCSIKPFSFALASSPETFFAQSDGFERAGTTMPDQLLGRPIVHDGTHRWGLERSAFLNQISSDQVIKPLRLDQLMTKSWHEKFLHVHMRVNGIGFSSDFSLYGIRDKWAEPREFLENGGDCEDFALTKYVSLKALGVHPQRMMIMGLIDKANGQAHASLFVIAPDGVHFVLDNQDALPVLEPDYKNRFQFAFALNHTGLWKPANRT